MLVENSTHGKDFQRQLIQEAVSMWAQSFRTIQVNSGQVAGVLG